MNKINVLQVSNGLGIGGTEKALETFAENLNKDLFNTYVCGIFEGGVRDELMRESGLQTSIVFGEKEKLFQLIKDKKIDIVHIHRSGKSEGFVIQTAKKAGVPVIVETNVFGLYDNGKTEKMIDIHLLVSKTASLKYIQNACISPNGFLNKRRVMYNPINLENFERLKPSEEQIRQFKSELGIDKDTPLICRVGRPDITKWSRFSIDMMSYLVKKIPEVKFLIVGGTSEEVRLKVKKLRLEENFVDIGFVSEEKLILIYYSIRP